MLSPKVERLAMLAELVVAYGQHGSGQPVSQVARASPSPVRAKTACSILVAWWLRRGTLPETNKSHRKIDGWEPTLPLEDVC